MLKFRNFIAVALVLGVAAGIWLSDLWKKFGGGGPGLGNGHNAAVVSSSESKTADDAAASTGGRSLRVIIRDHSYFLKNGRDETPISLDDLVQGVKNTSPDDDGLRVRVYRADDARVTAEVQLREALQRAQIPEAAAYWNPEPSP